MAGTFFKAKQRATVFRDEPPPRAMFWEELQLKQAGALMRDKLVRWEVMQGSYSLAYLALFLFTAALYIRPTELFPTIFEAYPIQFAKIFAVTAPLIFFFSRSIGSQSLFHMTREVKMAFVILAVAFVLMPISINFDDSWKEFNDNYLKVALIFGLMIGVLDSRERIYWLARLTVLVCAGIALDLLLKFNPSEKQILGADRVVGTIGGMFNNPNDLATHFGMLLPMAIVLFCVSRTPFRFVYAACAVVFVLATFATFSRGGLLGIAAVAGSMMWKFRKRHKAIPYVAGLMFLVVILLGAPGGLSDRLWTILRPNSESSSKERLDNLKRGIIVFARHPLNGIGMGTFHIIGIHERRAHNSYLEIAAELGGFALLAYLILIFNPLKSLWQIEQETVHAKGRANFENYLLSVGLQAALLAYYVNSFFLSLQYLWYVYYPVAYAVGLRLIYEREKALQQAVDERDELAKLHVGDELKGSLWRDRQRRPARPALIETLENPETESSALARLP